MFYFPVLFRVLNLEGASRRLYVDQSNVFFYVQKSLSCCVALRYCADKKIHKSYNFNLQSIVSASIQ